MPDIEPVMPKCENLKLLKGQKALVTGASSGIGKAIAIELGKYGADVAVNYVSGDDSVNEMIKEIESYSSRAIAIKTDVSKEDQVKSMFSQMCEELGTVDILVNNAGIQKDACLTDMSLDEWQKVIDVNLTGQFLCSREAAREFIRKGVKEEISCAAGKILCISSVHEIIPWSGHVNYAASKGGVMLMMKSMAQELAEYRIRVNSIAPGAIKTPINKPAWETPEKEAQLLKLIPYNRIGETQDIARVAAWLVSDYADYINGTTIVIDGGMTLYPGFREGG